jgi:hypothetical protein
VSTRHIARCERVTFMTLGHRVPLLLAAFLIVFVPAVAQTQTTTPVAPALADLTERVSLTTLDVTLGQAAGFLSDQSGYSIVVDPRYRDLRVSLAGADGALSEVLAAVCEATNMEARRLDRWIVLSPSARGIAVVAREMRAQYAPTLSADYDRLQAQRVAATRQALQYLGLATPGQAVAQLNDWQRAALAAQGHLTVAQLVPQYYLPLYDVFGYTVSGPIARPASLPESPASRVYLDPALRLDVHVPKTGGETVWPIDVIPERGQ